MNFRAKQNVRLIRDMPNIERPRERMLSVGHQNLKNHELLAILLGTGVRGKSAIDLAHELLTKYDSKRFATLTLNELIQVKGINSAKACSIIAARELTQRLLQLTTPQLPTIQDPRDVALLLTHLQTQAKEHFVALYLNARNQVIHQETITIGILNASLVHPREVFEPALRNLAAFLIIAHNHPSGNLEPSAEDLSVTRQLIQGGQILGIELLDHLIISREGFVSLKDKGYMN